MDDIKKFSAAILAGLQGQGASANIGGLSNEVNMALAPKSTRTLTGRGFGVGPLAGAVAEGEEKAAQAARSAKIKELEDMMDPGKYQRVRKDDGGFAFFDPSGKEIGIDTYTKRTGLRAAEVLKDSDNPLDRQYVNDYNNMNQLMNAAQNGDSNTVNTILEQNGLDKNLKPESYAQQLIAKYPHIYGIGSYDQSRGNLNKPVFAIRSEDDDEDDFAF